MHPCTRENPIAILSIEHLLPPTLKIANHLLSRAASPFRSLPSLPDRDAAAKWISECSRPARNSELHGHYFRIAPGILDGFRGVFSRKSAHDQCPYALGRHLDRSPINPLHILRGTDTATVHSHNKFDVFHRFFLSFEIVNKREVG
jgi:hypothetical protein